MVLLALQSILRCRETWASMRRLILVLRLSCFLFGWICFCERVVFWYYVLICVSKPLLFRIQDPILPFSFFRLLRRNTLDFFFSSLLFFERSSNYFNRYFIFIKQFFIKFLKDIIFYCNWKHAEHVNYCINWIDINFGWEALLQTCSSLIAFAWIRHLQIKAADQARRTRFVLKSVWKKNSNANCCSTNNWRQLLARWRKPLIVLVIRVLDHIWRHPKLKIWWIHFLIIRILVLFDTASQTAEFAPTKLISMCTLASFLRILNYL